MSETGGVYIIRHAPSGAFYLGSTVNFSDRKRRHWQTIRFGSKGPPNLKSLANATGNNPDDFTFSPLIVCAADDRGFFEDRALGFYQDAPGCLNAIGAGRVPDAATRGKMREAGKRKVFTPEHCAAISAALTGRRRGPLSPTTKAKLSASMTGTKMPPRSAEHRAKLSAANKGQVPWISGRRHTPEQLVRMSECQRGEKGFWFGKKFSVEARANMRAARLGKRHSPESIAKMRAVQQAIARQRARAG